MYVSIRINPNNPTLNPNPAAFRALGLLGLEASRGECRSTEASTQIPELNRCKRSKLFPVLAHGTHKPSESCLGVPYYDDGAIIVTDPQTLF